MRRALSAYLGESFGNEVRIDYGTGHETNFAIFLFCCCKAEIVDPRHDLAGLILKAFNTYIVTMRELQEIYMLEPAGSHGVWGLDDYQCLLFLGGSAQLKQKPGTVGTDDAEPPSQPCIIRDTTFMSDFAQEYMYLEGIRFEY